MRYWWVNQNQTFRQETDGGFLWSPKRSQGNRFNQFYENMREAAPADLVFSFSDTFIRAIGVVQGHCYGCPKPAEFGETGRNWDAIGWRVDVRFTHLNKQIRPMNNMSVLGPVLPTKYSPLQSNGYGNQAVYLAELPLPMAQILGGLIGQEFQMLVNVARGIATDEKSRATCDAQEMRIWEDHLVKKIESDAVLKETERVALVMSRRGQGLFRERVSQLEKCCRITKVDRPSHLVASHAKPWRDCTNNERLDGENGLLLTPTIDHLFDRGFISFGNDGDLLISPVAHVPSLQKMGVEVTSAVNVGGFSSGQRGYLDFHRSNVFLARSSA